MNQLLFENKDISDSLKEIIFNQLFNKTHDIVFLLELKPDNNYEYVITNESHREFIGQKKENIIGKIFGSFLKEEITEQLQKKFDNVLESGKAAKETIEFSFGNKTVLTETSLLPLQNPGTKTDYILIIAHDLTEHKQREHELVKMREAALESDKLKSALISNFSHEIRTPMNGMLGFAEILKEEIQNTDQKEMADNIIRSGKRLLNTLHSILELSLLESAGKQVNNSLIDINEIVISIAHKFEEEAKRKNLSLNIKPSQTEILLHTDEFLISQVISNILDNAIKFTDEGGVEISIENKTVNRELKALIKISDTGIGILDENLDLIFKEFRQVSEGYGRKFEGTGLGLTIAKKITELIRGKIHVESSVGIGSTFMIEVPAFMKNEKALPNIQDTSDSYIKHKEDTSVLLIEDNKINQKLIVHYLKGFYKVLCAEDYKTAFKLLSEYQIKIILMDINLGQNRNGIDLCREIRLTDKYKDITVIAVTGYASRFDREKIMSNGFDNYLTKPFEKKQLLDAINFKF